MAVFLDDICKIDLKWNLNWIENTITSLFVQVNLYRKSLKQVEHS